MKRLYLTEMARVGEFNNFKVSVYECEGLISHFHIYKGNLKKPEFHSCIRIDINEYFLHGNKLDILNSKQRKDLMEWLLSNNEDLDVSNYTAIIILWNMNNRKLKLNKDREIPNYLELK